jgi:hypothetical protein
MILAGNAGRSFGRPGPLPTAFPRKQLLYTGKTARPTIRAPAVATGRRRTSTESGDNESGHILTQKNEGIFFFDSKPS